MEKVVSTLPITSRNRISNAKVQGIITGGLLAHHLGADFTPWLGLNGRNSDTSVSAQNLFSTIALAYGPKNSTHIQSDINPSYVGFVQSSTSQLIKDGLLDLKESKLLACECGIVQIERDALDKMQIEKLQNIRRNLGVYACVHCDTRLVPETSLQIVSTPQLYESLLDSVSDMFPQLSVQAKAQSVIEESAARQKVLSRLSSKTQGIAVNIGGDKFTLDPDFSLLFTSAYSGSKRETALISGIRQIERVVGSMAVFKALEPSGKVISLLHPRIFVKPDNSLLSSPVGTDNESVIYSALITASSLSWKNHESRLSETDASMLLKMTSLIAAYEDRIAVGCLSKIVRPTRKNSISSFMRLYSPQYIRTVLKAIRKKRIQPQSDEATLISDILKL